MCVVDFDPPDFIAHAWRRARKPRRCYDCHATIFGGECYEYTSGKWDGRIDSFAHCEACVELGLAVNAADCSWAYGSLLDDAQATLDSYEHEGAPAAVGRVAGLLFAMRERQRAAWHAPKAGT